LRSREDEQENEYSSDEPKPENGRLRYWMFINGERTRLLSGLAAAFFAVIWCFAYFLGFAGTVAGKTALAFAVACLVVCWMLNGQLDRYQRAGWKDIRSPRVERVEGHIAIGLWLFIVLSICAILFWRWLHGH